MKTLLTAFLMLSLFAASARADLFEVKAKLACYSASQGNVSLERTKGDGSMIVGIAAGTDTESFNTLAFDSGTGDLQVVQRCDGGLVALLTHDLTCAFGEMGLERKLACPLELIDWGAAHVDGLLLCLDHEKEKQNGSLNFKGACDGAILINDIPCSLSFTFGKPFKTAGLCQ
jgi:hypothetical protein